MARPTATYDQYMQLVSQSPAPARLRDELHVVIERFRGTSGGNIYFTPTVFCVDYTTRKYVYLDENTINVIGHPASYYYDNGHEGFLRQTHPADYMVINKKVFPVNLQYLANTPPEKYAELVFSHNFRIQNMQGEWLTILQRYSYIAGNNCHSGPAAVMGVVFNITHFKSGQSIVHTIEETSLQSHTPVCRLLYKETYPVYATGVESLLSKRELEIVKYLADGLSSKQIAGMLFVSVHTINNHRKNMLQKTGCKSTAELLALAAKHGLV